MRKVDVQEMVRFLDGYLGKKIEVGISPVWLVQTYQHFGLNETENTFIFHDAGNENRQELAINKSQILEILLSEGEDVYDSVVSIELENGKIDFCISDMPVRCFKCHKIIDGPFETKWAIQGIGGYGSKFDGCGKMDIAVCDDCLYYKILGYVDGQFNLESEDYDNCLDKEKTCH